MYKPENVKLNELKENLVFCIFVDIRNSTFLNEQYIKKEDKKNKLLKIYSSFLNESYAIFNKNGFENIQIQGDGIFGLFKCDQAKTKMYTNVHKCIRDLLRNNNNLYNQYGIKITISVNFGNEIYSAFGYSKNKEKQLAYFGNVVSITKKINSLSFKKTILLISKKAWNELKVLQKSLKLKSKPKRFCFSHENVKFGLIRCWEKYEN